jgi:hypothetical protein
MHIWTTEIEHLNLYELNLKYLLLKRRQNIPVSALESQDPDAAKDEGPDFYPQTKQTVQMLLRDLQTMRKIAALN